MSRFIGMLRVVAVAGAAVVVLAPLGTEVAGATTTTKPGAPTITSVTPGDRSANVSYKKGSTGGTTIFFYKVTCTSSDGGSTHSNSERSSPTRVYDLTAGKTYTCTVVARNKHGYSPASAPSAAFIVGPNPPPTVPGAPTITGATPGVESVTVTYTAPASDGGAKILDYRITCTSSDGGVTRSTPERRSPTTVRHLTGAEDLHLHRDRTEQGR